MIKIILLYKKIIELKKMYFKTRKKLENIYFFKVYRPAMPKVTFAFDRYGCKHIPLILKHI